MPIEFRCTSCNKLLRTADDTAGKQAKCPQCGTVVDIPQSSMPSSSFGEPLGGLPSPGLPGSREPLGGTPFGAAPNINPYSAPLAYEAPHATVASGVGPIVKTKIDLGDVLGRSWRLYQNQMGMCIAAVLICGILNFGASLVLGQVSNATTLAAQAAGLDQGLVLALNFASVVLVQIVLFAIQTWLQIGQTIVLLKIARGQHADLSEVFKGGRFLLPGLGAGLLLALISIGITVPCLLPAGLAYLATQNQDVTMAALGLGVIVAVIATIVVTLMFCQYLPLIVDRNLGAIDALRTSREITVGNKLTLFLMFLVLGVVNLAGALACCVGLVFTAPYTALTMVMAYLLMTGQAVADPLQR